MEIICFFCGVLLIMWQNPVALIGFAVCLLFRLKLTYILAFVIAIIWCYCHQWFFMAAPLQNHAASLVGTVASIPQITPIKTQFVFDAAILNQHPIKQKILLTCYSACPVLRVGEKWQLQADIHAARPAANPGGFNEKRWLASRHIINRGIAQGGSFIRISVASGYYLLRLCERLSLNLAQFSWYDDIFLGIVEALSLGITSHIDSKAWDLFRRTGTTHLMIISGAHIGLVASLVYKVTNMLWRRIGCLCFIWPAQTVASIIALIIAFIYALISGFAVPAARAFIMCFFMLLRYIVPYKFGIWQALRYALVLILVLEPHSVLMPGFYLSFLAVCCLIVTDQRIRAKGIKQAVISQVACLIGLMPLTLFFFSYGAISGIVANIFAIPWVSLVIVPSALVAVALVLFIDCSWILSLLQLEIQVLVTYLQKIDALSAINITFNIATMFQLLAIMLAVILPLFLPIKALLPVPLILASIGLYPKVNRPDHGEFWADVLDVGQGLSIVVHTAHHTLLYDTGGRLYYGGDMGQRVVLPYLKTMRIKALDAIVVSHTDLDHRGGLSSIEQSYPNTKLIVNQPQFYHRGDNCHNYPKWQFDGVMFQFLPLSNTTAAQNDKSCVLKVATATHAILLAGDIEAKAEKFLVKKSGDLLQADVLIVPHHGSKTSSSQEFLQAVAPKVAILSVGINNRYHLPHKVILARYHNNGIPIVNTANCGMVRIAVSLDDVKTKC